MSFAAFFSLVAASSKTPNRALCALVSLSCAFSSAFDSFTPAFLALVPSPIALPTPENAN